MYFTEFSMRKSNRKHLVSVRFNDQERRELTEIYVSSGNWTNISEFSRRILLGELEHPFAELKPAISLDVKDTGPVIGSYENRVHYQAAVLAAHYLRIMHDPDYKRIIQANKDDFEAIIKDIRGYDFDELEAIKTPLHEDE